METDLEQKTDLVLRRSREAPNKGCQFVLGDIFVVGNWTIPVGFQTDLASVPIGMRNLVSRLDGIEASVVHDYLYRTGLVRRKTADAVFLELLRGSVPGWKRWIMWAGVRIGGGFSYKGK